MHMTRPAEASTKSCAILAAVAAVVLPFGSTLAATLEDSVRAALIHHPEVGVVAADREAIDQELRQARALYLPSLDFRAAAGPEYSNSAATRNRVTRPPNGDSSTTLLRLESQLTLTQMLFDGYAARSEVDRQLARIDSAAYRVDEAAEFTALDAIEAHLDVLRNQILVELSQDNIDQHQGILGRVSQGEQGGGGGIADLRQTEARLAAARSNLAVSIGNLRDAEARYLKVVGAPPDGLENRPAPTFALPESPEAAAARATFGSPTVKIANADIDVAKAELTGSRSGYYPRVDLELGASSNENLDGIKGGSVDAQALVVLRYNLFRGGSDVAREREAFARLDEAQAVLRQARVEAEQEARLSYNALLTASARGETLRAQSQANAATRAAYADEFNLGRRSLLDLLDAENELYLARANLTTAEFTEAFAVYRVLAVTGDLLEVLDIDRPKQGINIWRELGTTYGNGATTVRPAAGMDSLAPAEIDRPRVVLPRMETR
jgi:adhesin transport system outer membrane protein